MPENEIPPAMRVDFYFVPVRGMSCIASDCVTVSGFGKVIVPVRGMSCIW